MATPADLSPKQYEVLKLRNGLEVVGMTRDTSQGIEITLPMVCRLSSGPTPVETLATFYPYAPLTSDTKPLHKYFLDNSYCDYILENNDLKKIDSSIKNHPLIEQLKDSENPGLILFSTGTTGRPKGRDDRPTGLPCIPGNGRLDARSRISDILCPEIR